MNYMLDDDGMECNTGRFRNSQILVVVSYFALTVN